MSVTPEFGPGLPQGIEQEFITPEIMGETGMPMQAAETTPEFTPISVEEARCSVSSLWAETEASLDQPVQAEVAAVLPTDAPEAKTGAKKSKVRPATEADLDRLAEIDLMMFKNAYGQDIPEHAEVREMLAKRLSNIQGGGGHMMVCEADGEVNGFCTFFKTEKTWDDFSSWEETTNNGTLDGVVNPEGKYAYVANMTVTPKGSEVRAMQKIMVNLIGIAMKEDIQAGFFVSRIPEFTKWLKEEGVDYTQASTETLDRMAQEYVDKTSISKKGKEEPYDYELRVYTRSGFDKGELVNAGFSDDESLCYGVTFRVPIPLAGKPKPLRVVAGKAISLLGRSTKIIDKLF